MKATQGDKDLHDALTLWFTPALRKRLLLGLAASIGLPWLLGEWAKTFVQPGLHNDAERMQLLIDFIVRGAMLFSLTMLLTWLIGRWILAVMKGKQYLGDAFPEDEAQARHD
ncbi:MAG: hypothetical protein JOY60_11285 [Burkholderiaceae bacterium]|nr:hypothetical protein [Roseateles sp.]MBV8470425.1 hypothetical protein [Burkholderiaceae bacterium]